MAERAARRPPATAERLGALLRWETLLALVLLGLVVVGMLLSPVFLTNRNVSNLVSALIEVALMSLPMAFVIIGGEIDLSVESMAGLSSAVLGFLFASGVPIEVGIPIVLVIGAAGGLLNGLLVTRAGLPSLVVTLGTLALFRGMALIVLGPGASAASRTGSRPSASTRSPARRSRGPSCPTSCSPSSSASSSIARGSAGSCTRPARTSPRPGSRAFPSHG